MSSPDGSGSSTARSKRRREPETLEEAWRLHCKHSVAGSRRAACKYAAWPTAMPPTLADYAAGGRYHTVDPPPRPMSGPQFAKWRADWELHQQCKRGGDGASGSGGGGAATAQEEEVPATEEEEEAAFAAAVGLSKKEAAAAARAEAEEEAKAVADVEQFKAMEASGPVVFLD